jgi:uncharacterized coiled-coil protein SlyX
MSRAPDRAFGARARGPAHDGSEAHAVKQPTRRQVATLADRMTGAWRARQPDADPAPAPSLGAELEERLHALDERIVHLETALEGLQDALYREAVRGDEGRAELHKLTDPERIARELSADARRRGL